MNSSDISIISKQMESMSISQHVIRHNKKLPKSRYSPYTKEETSFTNEKQKEEAVRLGVEYSLVVAEAMFTLSDDIRSMLFFCPLILNYAGYKDFKGPVVGRVFYGILHVFETYFKPKNGVYKDAGKSIQWGLIGKSLHNFSFGIKELDRMVSILGKSESESSFGRVLKPSDFEHYSQELKKLEKKLRSFKDVSEANGFPREAIKSHILHLWKSLFETSQPEMINPKIRFLEMFKPLLHQAREDICSRLLTSCHI